MQPGGPVRQPYLTHRPARLHRLAESIPWNRFLGSLKGLQVRALIYFFCWWNNGAVCCERESLWLIVQQWPVQSKWQAVDGYRAVPVGGDHTANSTLGISYSLPQIRQWEGITYKELQQGVTKRCRLSWLTNSVLV
jgi:hypothetical protein